MNKFIPEPGPIIVGKCDNIYSMHVTRRNKCMVTYHFFFHFYCLFISPQVGTNATGTQYLVSQRLEM